ncbi:MAG: hypothetical protein IKR09_02655 [Alphaproteobacteria bacterium]|nr:hypothetical protein [Alphaproteobacteria bacterium]
MNLQEMIVTDSEGKIQTADGNDLTGQCIQSEDMYSFYAIKKVNDPSLKPAADQMAAKIRLTMPVGGEMNGMYRFPRIGEKVLVAIEGTSHYLMSYLPNAENPFSPIEDEKEVSDVFDEEGLVLRYKKTGENVADENRDEKYSEIGFYKEPSRWQTTDENLQNTEKSVEEDDGEGNKTYYPYIDTVKVSSTGDLTSSAQNLNELKGRRVSIESKFLFGDRKAKDKDGKEITVPGNIKEDLEERVLDESEINKGDIYLNADNKIVISARNGIQLDCGGASITLDPTGISISAAKVDGLEAGEGPFDSEISLKHNGDVNLNGKMLTGYFSKAMFMEDGFGGGFICNSGSMDIFGRSVSVGASTTFAQTSYVMEGLAYTLEQTVSVPRSSRKKTFGGLKSGAITEPIEKVLALADRIGEGFAKDAGAEDGKPDPSKKAKALGLVTKILNLILAMVRNVRSVVETKYYDDYILHYDKSDKKYYMEDNRADATLAFDITEATLVTGIQSFLLASASDAMWHEACISMTPNADLVLDSKGYYQASLMDQDANVVMAGVPLDAPDQNPPQQPQQQQEEAPESALDKANRRMDKINRFMGARAAPDIALLAYRRIFGGKDVDKETEEELEAL